MINISFIIPVYNQEKYIESFLRTLCAVKIPDTEIICVDDGSTDNTAAMLDRAAENNAMIRVYHIENRGPGHARNFGLGAARGKYIAFCDSDDGIHTDLYEKMYNMITKEGKELVLTNFREIYDSGEVIERTFRFKSSHDHWELLRHIALYGKIFSREFIEKNDIRFPETYQAEDRVFLGRVVVAKPDFLWLDGISYDYLRHESARRETLTHTYSFAHFEQRIKCWHDFYNICSGEYPAETKMNILHGMAFIYRVWAKLPLETKGDGLALIRKLLDFPQRGEIGKKEVFGLPLEEFLKTSSYEEYARAVIEKSTNRTVRRHKKMENPCVSVIMPLYNAGKYLRKCLQSLCEQTFDDFELICIDDGSEDNTIEIVQEYMTFDKRIDLLRQNHGLAGVARNLGMARAKGEYYLFLDGDDFFAPQLLERSVKKIKEDNAEICLFDAQLYFSDTGEIKRPGIYLKHEFLPAKIPFEGKSYPYIFNLSTASPWNKLIKRSLVDEYEIRFMPLQRCNDVYFIFLTMAVAKRITVLDKVLVNYRQSDASLQASNDKSPYDWYLALIALKKKLVQLSIFDAVEQSFINYALSLSIYNLFSLKTAAAFCDIYNRARTQMFKELGITGYDSAKFYPNNRDKYKKYSYVMSHSVEEYMFEQIKELKGEKWYWLKRAKKAEEKTQNIRKSLTFRVGNAIMRIPRRIKNRLMRLKAK